MFAYPTVVSIDWFKVSAEASKDEKAKEEEEEEAPVVKLPVFFG